MTDYSIVLNTVNISEEDFFNLTQERQNEIDYSLLDIERFNSLLIKAPSNIDISKRNELPVLKIIQNDGIREWYVSESRNLLASVYNIQTGHLVAKTARKDTKNRVYPPKNENRGPLPKGMSETSYSTGTEIIDIKSSLEIPWVSSMNRITLICFDWVSNTVDVVLHDQKNNPEVVIIPPQVNELVIDAFLSSQLDNKNEIITFSVPKKCNPNLNTLTIRGVFSVPVSTHGIIEVDKVKRAVVPVWFMIVEKDIDQGSAILAKWFISADPSEKNLEETVAKGEFSFTLSDILPIIKEEPLTPNEYCCYMIVNGNVFGPEKCSITK